MRRWYKRFFDGVGVALFASLFAVFVLQITARFVFSRPLPWTDELAVILFIWIIIWAAAFMVPRQDHVAFDVIFNLFGNRGRGFALTAGNLLTGTLALWALPATWDYVRFMNREGTPVLGISFMWVFLPFVFLLLKLAWDGLFATIQLFPAATKLKSHDEKPDAAP